MDRVPYFILVQKAEIRKRLQAHFEENYEIFHEECDYFILNFNYVKGIVQVLSIGDEIKDL